MTGVLLRGCAIAIAVAAFLDVPIEMSTRPRRRVAIVSSPAAVVAPAVAEIRDRLAKDLRGDFDVTNGPDPTAQAAVFIGDRYPTNTIGVPERVFTVTVDSNVAGPRIVAVRAPRAVVGGSKIRLDVDLEAASTPNTSTSIVVVTARGDRQDVEAARASHTWSADVHRASLAIDALPIDLPPWRLRVQLLDGGHPSPPSVSDVLVEAAPRKRVLFYEPRPSWIATFVRRALERDSAFDVSGLDYPSRNVAVFTGDAPSLDQRTLRSFDVVVVGGLDRLSVPDRDRISWFARERGGSVVLLPDGRVDAGPARDWLVGIEPKELLLERPTPLAVASSLPAIQGAELLALTRNAENHAAMAGVTVLARVKTSGEPVVVLAPEGAGRVLVSGALDAWRYRAEDDAAFDRFWRAAIAGVALAAPPAVDVQLVPSVARPGDHVRAVVRVRRAAAGLASGADLRVTGQVDDAEMLRLWPEAEADVFSGSFAAGATGLHKVSVSASAGDSTELGAGFLAVDQSARHAEPNRPPLAMLAESRGGIDVAPDRLSDLEHRLRQLDAPAPVAATIRPMRSAFWMMPFATCLAAEWWLRRKKGER